MKKLLLALVSVAFLFTACNKEGVYTPKKKISAVYYQKAGEDSKELLDIYHWNGKKLEAKMFRGSILSPYLHDFEVSPTYDGKRIVRVDETITGDYVDFVYDGKFLSKLVYHSGNTMKEATVEHKDGKISRIFFPAAQTTDNPCAEKLLAMFFPQSNIINIGKILSRNSKSLSVVDVELLFTWDGDNVSKIVNSILMDGVAIVSETSKLSYDDKINPYAASWVDFGSEIQLTQNINGCRTLAMSKNNVTKIDYTGIIDLDFYDEPQVDAYVENIEYEYDGKYPVKATYKYENGNTDCYHYFEYIK